MNSLQRSIIALTKFFLKLSASLQGSPYVLRSSGCDFSYRAIQIGAYPDCHGHAMGTVGVLGPIWAFISFLIAVKILVILPMFEFARRYHLVESFFLMTICCAAYNEIYFAQSMSLLSDIKSGSLRDVREANDLFADLNLGENGKSLLPIAVKNEDLRMVELLLEEGADPDKQGHFQTYALIDAVKTQNVKIVKGLIEGGAGSRPFPYGEPVRSALRLPNQEIV